MIDRQIDSPIPMPSDFVVNSGLNMRSSVMRVNSRAGIRDRYPYVAIIMHWIVTESIRDPPTSAIASIAFVIKFISTC